MSSLTGEPDAIEMGPEKRSLVPAEARNLVFNSTLVMNGEARGIVYKVRRMGRAGGWASKSRTQRERVE
jgi:magnesium-transporting ATPase (P-type)